MKLAFKIPRVPNFIPTKQGTFAIEELSPEEINEYIKYWSKYLIENYETRKKETI